MKIPTPSFFKIRIIALILCFVALCFFVGMLKGAFAGWPGECTIKKYVITAESPASEGTYVYGTTSLTWNETDGLLTWTADSLNTDNARKTYQFYWYYYENGTWNQEGQANRSVFNTDEIPHGFEAGDHSIPTGGCPCTDEERQQEIEKCAVNGMLYSCLYNFDESTCTATCLDAPCWNSEATFMQVTATKCGGAINIDLENTYWESPCSCQDTCLPPCVGDGEETREEAAARCLAEDKVLIEYEGEPTCRGICSYGCTEGQFEREVERCKPFGLKSFSEVTCKGICEDCADKRDEAEANCRNIGKVLKSYECDADGDVLPLCKDPDPIQPDPEPGDPGQDPDDPPQDPPPDKDPSDPGDEDPENPSEDELNAINDNLKSIVEQNNDRKDQLQNIANDSKNIADNQKITADNTAKTVDAINNLAKDGIEAKLGKEDSKNLDRMRKDIDSMGDSIGRMAADVEEIRDGTYTTPGEEEEYTTDEYDFGDRTTEFLSQMRTTGVFSLPDKLTSSIPGGGSSTLVIEGGNTYGDHTIDFSDYSAAILILRSVFQIAGMVLAIRIVTLKR